MAGLEGQIIGGCRILQRLGGGGMGEVYLAEQVRLKRQVAVKIVRPGLEAVQGGADLTERFAREAQAIAAMEHPHILPVYDFGEQEHLAYLVMAYAPDGSLQEALTPGHPRFRFRLPLTLSLCGMLLDQAAQALQHAHDRGVLHRDVKPANFLLRPGASGGVHLLLADFGLAKFTQGATQSGVYSGTAIYSAPEQIQRQATPASDQYSLAVMIYLLLTGRPPFSGGLAEVVLQQLQAPPPSLRVLNPAVPVEIELVVLRALAKKPEERWPDVSAFAAAYRGALEAAGKSTVSAPSASSSPTTHAGLAPVHPQAGVPVSAQPLNPPLVRPTPAPAQSPAPVASPTQVAAVTPDASFGLPPQQITARESSFDKDSFVAGGPLLPLVLPASGDGQQGWRRRRWRGWVGGLGAVVAIILLVVLGTNLLAGHAGTATRPGVASAGTPGAGSTLPVGSKGPHIVSVQTGRYISGDLSSCQVQIDEPTTRFVSQRDAVIDVVFTAINDGNPKAEAGAALLDSRGQILSTDGVGRVACPGKGNYAAYLAIQHVPPGTYTVGVFYSETETLPQQPEATVQVSIQK